jgi:hypothetical protein
MALRKDDQLGLRISKELKETFKQACGPIPYTRVVIALIKMFSDMPKEKQFALIEQHLKDSQY